MNPAFSVIFLTTLIGAGQGLFLALVALEWFGHAAHHRGGAALLMGGAAVSLVLTAAGLVASFFHLGRPERAWRTATMWRTSWLSREVIVLPLFMAGVLAWLVAHATGQQGTGLLGVLVALISLALFLCTAMIYASVKFLQEWASHFTVINYFLLGMASGCTLATALAAMLWPSAVPALGVAAIGFTVAGGVSRALSLRRNARLKPKSTLQSAIGVRHPKITQRAMGFMGGSFNTREFFHGQSLGTLRHVKWVFLVAAFVLPLLLLVLGLVQESRGWLILAFVVQYVGLLAERWFFFAQARHPQNLYYQTVA